MILDIDYNLISTTELKTVISNSSIKTCKSMTWACRCVYFSHDFTDFEHVKWLKLISFAESMLSACSSWAHSSVCYQQSSELLTNETDEAMVEHRMSIKEPNVRPVKNMFHKFTNSSANWHLWCPFHWQHQSKQQCVLDKRFSGWVYYKKC